MLISDQQYNSSGQCTWFAIYAHQVQAWPPYMVDGLVLWSHHLKSQPGAVKLQCHFSSSRCSSQTKAPGIDLIMLF